MYIARLLVLVFCLVFISGCLGTISTRDKGNFAGGYPYQAVAFDGYCVAEARGNLAPGGLVSMPLDLVVDTVLLPIDLLLWPFGFKKVTYFPVAAP